MQACGVCHSDVLTKEGSWPGIEYPRVPGHEVAGIIDEVGVGVSAWKKGQRVGVGWHGGQDNTCRECRRGDFRNCRNVKIPGISYDGGYQQYMVAPVEALVPIPESLKDAEAAPLLCAGITTYNALRHSGALPGDLVAVQGIGGLGHLGIQFASKFGYKVAAIGRGPENAKHSQRNSERAVYIDSQVDECGRGIAEAGRGTSDSGDSSEFESDVGTDRRSGAERQAHGDRCVFRSHRGHAPTAHQRKPNDSRVGCGNTRPIPRTHCTSPN